MTTKRLLIHSVFLFLLPLIVAWFGVSIPGAFLLIVVALVWRWMITLSGFAAPEKVPDLELETISASHFVEKVRWCMDRLGLDYRERQVVGVMGAFFTGRSVPLLRIRTGLVRSTIGNSPEILRYLWGQYSALLGEKADFLTPTQERLALEKRLDRYGKDMQVWVYYHILDDRKLTQHAWGCNSPAIPAWQRYLVIAIFPVLRFFIRTAFRITDTHYHKSVEHIEQILAEMDTLLADGRKSILGDGSVNYVDITFASLSALWVQPTQFGKGKADDVRVDLEDAPAGMRADMDRWTKNYPNASEFINRLYESER
jgi:glutathione S-transferase